MIEILRFLGNNPKILSIIFTIGMVTALLLEVYNSKKEKM
jgi:hypothetical protein